MFENLKNLKFVQNLKESKNQKLHWTDYANKSALDRSTTDYLEEISGVTELDSKTLELEAMVRAQLRDEFPKIKNMENYEALVQKVMQNLKSKNITCIDDLDK